MKTLFITAILVGVATAVLIVYYSDDTAFSSRKTKVTDTDDVDDAAKDAYNTMNKHIGRVERKTEDVFNALN